MIVYTVGTITEYSTEGLARASDVIVTEIRSILKLEIPVSQNVKVKIRIIYY